MAAAVASIFQPSTLSFNTNTVHQSCYRTYRRRPSTELLIGKPRYNQDIMQPSLKRKQSERAISIKFATKRIRLTATRRSFFDLPRELRDQIYHEIWSTESPSNCQIADYAFDVDYECNENRSPVPKSPSRNEHQSCRCKRGRSTKPRSPWFIPNKQFMHEAIEQLQRRTHWRLRTGQTASSPSRKTIIKANKCLLNPWHGKSLTLTDKYAYCTMAIQDNGKVGALLGFTDATARHFEGLRALATETPRLKHLFVNFGVSSQSLEHLGGARPTVDFSALEYLQASNVKDVEFTLILPKGNRFDAALKEGIQEETRNSGKEILGGEVKDHIAVISPLALAYYRNAYFQRYPNAIIWKHKISRC